MNFGEAISSSLSKYATFSGRASRSEFWLFYLFYVLLIFLSFFLALASHPLVFLIPAVALGLYIPMWAVSVRRAHDTDNSGWMLLIPFYGWIIHFLPSVRYDNQYGPYLG